MERRDPIHYLAVCSFQFKDEPRRARSFFIFLRVLRELRGLKTRSYNRYSSGLPRFAQYQPYSRRDYYRQNKNRENTLADPDLADLVDPDLNRKYRRPL